MTLQLNNDQGNNVAIDYVNGATNDRTVTFPDASGTVVLTDDGNTDIVRAPIFIGETTDNGADSSAFLTRQGGSNNFQVTGGGTVRIGGTLPGAPRIELSHNNDCLFNAQVNVGGDAATQGQLGTSIQGGFISIRGNSPNTAIQILNTTNNNNQILLGSNGVISAQNTAITQLGGSERRLKENITLVDPSKAWEAVKSAPFYAWNYIGSDAENVIYGPMVDEIPSDMVVKTCQSDEQGDIRTYDNPLLQARIYVALQQALKRIEALEAEVAALKGGSE